MWGGTPVCREALWEPKASARFSGGAGHLSFWCKPGPWWGDHSSAPPNRKRAEIPESMLRAKFSKSLFTWGAERHFLNWTHTPPQTPVRPETKHPLSALLGASSFTLPAWSWKAGGPPEATADAQAGVPLGLRAIGGTGGDLHPESAQLPSIQTGLRLGAKRARTHSRCSWLYFGLSILCPLF